MAKYNNNLSIAMNELRRLINLFEAAVDQSALSDMKSVIANKIKDLPPDDATIKALREIEDLLRHINAGGKAGIINGELKSVDDATVLAAQKELARYILSMEMTPEQRDELFTLWRADKLVKRDVLLSKGKTDFSKIINKYDTNPAIKELVNDVMRIAALGQGKGEFGLSVLSKSIHKQEGKGDLSINGRAIEVKTTDGGAGRFTDQEVRPGAGFEQAARALSTAIKQYHPTMAKSGANLDGIVNLYGVMKGNPDLKAETSEMYTLIENCIKLIFEGLDISKIMKAIDDGNVNGAKQEYAKASFNYYMGKKKDEGVLYISLAKDPIMTVYFRDADELAASGLRLHAGTVYITSVADVRLPYPQIEIVDTSGSTFDPAGSGGEPAPDPVKAPSAVTGKRVSADQISSGPGAKAGKRDLGRATR